MITTHDSIFSLPTNKKPCNMQAIKQARKQARKKDLEEKGFRTNQGLETGRRKGRA
jgi:hypothetical protein